MHTRKSIRLRGHDYTESGVYFVTICTHEKRCLFGAVVDDLVRLNPLGRIVDDEIQRTPQIRPNIAVDAYVVMPSHVHIVFDLSDNPNRASRRLAPTTGNGPGGASSGSLCAIVGQIKSTVTKRHAALGQAAHVSIWQRGYYDRIVRSIKELDGIRAYIAANPANWTADALYFSDMP